MKTNDLNVVRRQIEKYITSKKLDGKRVHINKEDLDKLLFDECTFKSGEKVITLRYPIWTGSFLKNVDLSEINFDDDKENGVYYIFDHYSYASIKEDVSKEKVSNHIHGRKYEIDFSDTNAKFNFEKMFLFKKIYRPLNLRDCNFSGMKLNDSNISDLFNRVSVANCSFKNSKLAINMDDFYKNLIFGCDFTNVKIENSDVCIEKMIESERDRFFIYKESAFKGKK